LLRVETFKIKNLIITADDGNYLVHVEWNSENTGAHTVQDLPAWIFESRYAIWLTNRDVPIGVRASEGEQIKQSLIKEFVL
jgi:hypothetical protein